MYEARRPSVTSSHIERLDKQTQSTNIIPEATDNSALISQAPAMANNNLVLLLLLIVAASFAAASASRTKISSSRATPTVYEMLADYDFPPGILPEGVQNYTLHADGSFDVFLPSACEIDVSSFKLQYESTIHGSIKNMVIDELQGVSVNVAVTRVGITGVDRDGDLKFDTGVISKSFPVGTFAVSPYCS
ncbi:hypothetical protein QYE76_064231 [Lolium multiflorum]|uniref:Uncharacterized protein n=1 Tax=Lolium multiflorum TaxID=4521 RepID=A0AAD8W7F4_LOLMU|nr:hypothetical protein QYE76_064231 [Lolium multiflorum]